ncbi:MAG: hypothetical protein LBP19_03905 [Treponema sp.]|jgi:imidazoleglycerol phosphate synthase glutamine amidotransferase subunit HisH|nr:hypothetical protein [Treponema sp.]
MDTSGQALSRHLHTFFLRGSADASIMAVEAEYYCTYCSALCAVQFHSEKSGAAGLMLLENWVTGT